MSLPLTPRAAAATATALAVLAVAAGGTPARAQAPAAARPAATAPAAAPLTAAVRRDVVDSIAAQLRRHYIEADTGRMIGDHLRARLAAGAYDGVTSPLRFAELLGDDLRAVNGDRHLYVVYDPEHVAERPGPEGIRMLGPDDGPGRSPSPEMIASARRAHFNLGRADVLAGNVGYLDVRGFSGAPEAEDAVVAALRYLQYTDAMIVDLRRNGGGSAELVNFLISHFTGPDTLASLTVHNRSGNETFTRYTLAKVPGPRRPSVPLYVLTSRYTASAGEDFAFVLGNLGRATVVGDRTAGAGRNNALLDVGHGFGASVSFSRVSDPRTGREWEGVGVQPMVAVEPERALDVAHSLALKAIAEKEQDARRRRVVELTREGIEAQLAPRAVPAATLAGYAGDYEGGRSVQVADGKLLYRPRPGVPADALVPLGDDTFGLNATRFVFERAGGAVTRLRVINPDGQSLTYGRAQKGSATPRS